MIQMWGKEYENYAKIFKAMKETFQEVVRKILASSA